MYTRRSRCLSPVLPLSLPLNSFLIKCHLLFFPMKRPGLFGDVPCASKFMTNTDAKSTCSALSNTHTALLGLDCAAVFSLSDVVCQQVFLVQFTRASAIKEPACSDSPGRGNLCFLPNRLSIHRLVKQKLLSVEQTSL